MSNKPERFVMNNLIESLPFEKKEEPNVFLAIWNNSNNLVVSSETFNEFMKMVRKFGTPDTIKFMKIGKK